MNGFPHLPALTCICCLEKGPVSVHDRELDGMVCEDCRQKLRAGTAWMKAAGIVGCTQAHGSRAQTPPPKGGAQ